MSHGGFLRQHSDDPEFASHIMHDYTQADLDDQTRGMLDFAVKLTKDPAKNTKADLQKLRDLGLDEQHVLATVLITCFFNFMTRLADGLGVQVPEGRQEAHERWLTGPALQQEWLMTAKP